MTEETKREPKVKHHHHHYFLIALKQAVICSGARERWGSQSTSTQHQCLGWSHLSSVKMAERNINSDNNQIQEHGTMERQRDPAVEGTQHLFTLDSIHTCSNGTLVTLSQDRQHQITWTVHGKTLPQGHIKPGCFDHTVCHV